MKPFKLLQTLSETPGPSGFESPIAAVIQAIWEPLVDEIYVDRLGSLVAVKKGRGDRKPGHDHRHRVLLAAHMDEIGLMVKKIVDFGGSGFLRVDSLGGVDFRHLYGQQVVVHGRDGESDRSLRGVLGAPPNALLPPQKANKPFDYEALVVDPGLPFETLNNLVSVGDAVTFYQPLRQLEGKWVSGKALDNRASIAAVTDCLERLQERPHDWDIITLASCQEETRLLGAATTAHRYNPDIAVAIDVTFGKGPGATDEKAFKIGGGPVIRFAPDTHRGVQTLLKEAAQNLEMTVQSEYVAYPGGTDAYAMQIASEGIPTGIVSLPLRYMHTMVETLSLKDITRTGRLLTEFCGQLNGETSKKLQKTLLPAGENL